MSASRSSRGPIVRGETYLDWNATGMLRPEARAAVTDALANPQLELHDATSLIGQNNDWQATQIGGIITGDQVTEIQASGLAPTDPLESAIIATLQPGSYTAIVRGVNNTTGIGVVEAYDLDRTVDSKLGNISTRGLVQTNDNVMIGGLIVLGQNPLRVIVRAIGPSLSAFGIGNALQDTTLELHNGNGATIATSAGDLTSAPFPDGASLKWREESQSAVLLINVELVEIGNFPMPQKNMCHYFPPPIAFFKLRTSSMVLSTVIFS
jgi:hypothetical protein